MSERLRRHLLLILASALCALGLTIGPLWYLTPSGLALFFIVIRSYAITDRYAFFSGAFFGTITAGAGIVWVFDALPLTWLGVEKGAALAAVSLTFIMVALVMGLPCAIAAWFLRRVSANLFFPLIAGIVWMLAEEGRMWAFAFLSYAPESLLAPHFSVAAVGYPLAESSHFLAFATWGGLATLSFVSATSAGALSVLVNNPRTMGRYIALGMFIILFLVPFFAPQASVGDTTLSVMVANAYVPPGVQEDSTTVENVIDAVRTHNEKPDLLVFTEHSGPERIWIADTHMSQRLRDAFGSQDALVLSGAYAPAGRNGAHAQLVYRTVHDGIIATYDKIFLMPLGEYAPIGARALFALVGDAGIMRYISGLETGLSRGTRLVAVPWKGTVVGGLLCSEVFSPHLFQQLAAQEHARVLVNVADTSWFFSSYTLHTKMMQAAKIHAVQHRAWFIQATNGAPSFIIAPDGRIVAHTPWGNSAPLRVMLTL